MPIINTSSTTSVTAARVVDGTQTLVKTSTTSSVTTLSAKDLEAIKALEDTIIANADPDFPQQSESETRQAYISRCLIAKGTAALSIAVKGDGGDILWYKTYGVKRNAQGLADAVKNGLKDATLPPWMANANEEEVSDFHAEQRKERDEILTESVLDTAECLGLKDSPVTFATVFQAASISKPITAMAIMRLVQRGVLDLNRDIREYLETAEWKLPVSLSDGVDLNQPTTLRQLLGHAAGTSVSGFGGYNRKQVRVGKIALPSIVQVLNGDGNSGKVEINALPNTIPQYSGGGTTVAQFVVETVTGKPMSQIIDEEIVKPLNLTNTTATLEDSPNGGDFACAHMFTECLPVAGGYHLYPETSAAGLWTTPMEILKIQDALFKSLQGNSEFLSKDLAQEMVTARYPSFAGACPGVGWFVTDCDFTHSGGNAGFVCDAYTNKHTGSGIAWMASSEFEAFDLMEDARKAISKAYGFPERAPRVKPTPKKGVPESLDDCLGIYSMIVSAGNLFSSDFVKPIIRVAKSEKEGQELDFFFPSLNGGVSSTRKSNQENSEDFFKFKVLDRMVGEFTVRENGEIWFSFEGTHFVKE
ncbi:UNVERIFIED_CONTAM: hypothetical protein HDU68_005525 [Siphonaria sp. JEL0065]|nr:hypothetical protein HDU68_005525 [Siphonaria sp. JEL0065]